MEDYSLAIREGLRNFWRERTLGFAMIGCIAAAVFAIGAFGLVAFNVNYFLKRWESRLELVAFLQHEVRESDAQEIVKRIDLVPGVHTARLITGRESWERLSSEVHGSPAVGGVPIEDVLPFSVVIALVPEQRNLADLKKVASYVAQVKGVDEVKFEESLIERYMKFRRDSTILAAGSSCFWTLIFGLILVNIAKLASAVREDEIRTLEMLGGSTTFIRRVFVVEGIAQGVSGATLGVAALIAAVVLLSRRVSGSLQLPGQLFAATFIVGPVLGYLAQRFSIRNLITVSAVILVAAFPVRGMAETRDTKGDESLRYQRELERIETELRETRKAARSLAVQEDAVASELEEVEKGIDSLGEQIKQAKTNITRNKEEIAATEAELPRCEEEYEQSKKELGQWLRVLCNQREPSMVEVILYDIPQSEMTMRRKMTSVLVQKEFEALERASNLRQVLTQRKENLRKRVELDTLYTEVAGLRTKQLIEKRERREVLLAKLREQKNIYIASIRDMQLDAQDLQKLIDAQQEASVAIAGSVPFREMKGLLPWPVDGEVSVPYGRIKNPGSYTYTPHLGLDIAASAGSDIRAIHDAVVAYCDWFKGYGKLLILDHGGGYSSIYCHCSEMLVQKGDIVKAGQVVARVGETGSLKGPFLYFEIRENGQPVDPTVWLQRRSVNAT